MRPASLVAWRWLSLKYAGHRDDRLGDLLAEVVLGGLLHLLQDEGGDLRGAVLLAADLDPGVAVVALDDLVGRDLQRPSAPRRRRSAADQALDREDGVLRVGDRLAAGDLADQALAALGERDHRRGDAAALGVGDDDRLAALHDRDAGVRGSEIDADDFGHVTILLRRRFNHRLGALARFGRTGRAPCRPSPAPGAAGGRAGDSRAGAPR